MKVVIAGSRSLSDYSLVVIAMDLSQLVPTEVVSGRARGIDQLGEEWADKRSIPVKPFPADWGRHGKQYAGFVRNALMAAYADALVAVWDGVSSGTADMIAKMRWRGKPCFVCNTKTGVSAWVGEREGGV